jgi:hypothetical protein
MDAIAARSIDERLEEWAEFNRAFARAEADGIRHRHRDHDDRQVFLALVRHRYGDDLVRAAWPNDDLLDP